jgi:hypothetical protein
MGGLRGQNLKRRALRVLAAWQKSSVYAHRHEGLLNAGHSARALATTWSAQGNTDCAPWPDCAVLCRTGIT